MYANIEEFGRAIEGEYGPEEQAEAERFAEETGLLANWEREDAAERQQGHLDTLEKEFQRLEARLGRKLTEGEEQAMIDSISEGDQRDGTIPDLVSTYGDQLANAGNTEQGRMHLAAEAAHAAMAGQGRHLEPPPMPNLTHPGQQGEE